MTAAPVLTPIEAQTLPVAELARRVLGAAGAVVVDVERPGWPVCVGRCPRDPSQADGPPPVRAITFYTRAFASSAADWLGCAARAALTVSFGADGAVDHVLQSDTVGWLGALTRATTGTGPAALAASSAQYAGMGMRCRALPTTRGFVHAFAPGDGERAIVAVALTHASMARGGSIRVTCAIDMTVHSSCTTPAARAALADDVTVANMTSVERVDPRTGSFVDGGPVESGCYEIGLARTFSSADSITVCVRVGDTLRVTRATFSRGRVVY